MNNWPQEHWRTSCKYFAHLPICFKKKLIDQLKWWYFSNLPKTSAWFFSSTKIQNVYISKPEQEGFSKSKALDQPQVFLKVVPKWLTEQGVLPLQPGLQTSSNSKASFPPALHNAVTVQKINSFGSRSLL